MIDDANISILYKKTYLSFVFLLKKSPYPLIPIQHLKLSSQTTMQKKLKYK